ncbi:hypothetical protein [Xanthomonas fragariae]|uniref:hypothetical protein n=1 Tax=Xanthomonas fragariae TaxID=48664 RepID=UPI001EDDC99D|nr:hypothetical protein [Xanthomonas fragariae]
MIEHLTCHDGGQIQRFGPRSTRSCLDEDEMCRAARNGGEITAKTQAFEEPDKFADRLKPHQLRWLLVTLVTVAKEIAIEQVKIAREFAPMDGLAIG